MIFRRAGKIVRSKIALLQSKKVAGFEEVSGGKGSHRKFAHEHYAGAVTVSGKSSSDAKRYQEKQIGNAIESLKS